MIDAKLIKQLREETGAGVMEAKQILEEFKGDYDKALAHILAKAGHKAAKKADRNAKDGLIFSYIHNTGKLGSLIHMACETDFVAKTDDFRALCKEIAMQVCTEDVDSVEDFVKLPYMRDESKTIQDYINEVTAKVGEKLELKRFVKFAVNE